MMDWIQGDKFMRMADFAFFPHVRQSDDYYGFPNTFNINNLKDRNIVFTMPFYVNRLFDIIRPLKNKFIVITHNGDNRIDPDGIVTLSGTGLTVSVDPYFIPENVIKWFAQNVNVIDPRIESIPIGLENDLWFPRMRKKEKMLEKLREPRNYKNLVYMNHTNSTNPQERTHIYDLLENKSWVTAHRFTNGSNFDTYIDNIYNHKFVICPPGNGMDTHRIWETLYMGSFPIVKKDINNWFYNELPILYINKWEEITELLLDVTRLWYNDHKGWEPMLTFKYWEDKIRNADL